MYPGETVPSQRTQFKRTIPVWCLEKQDETQGSGCVRKKQICKQNSRADRQQITTNNNQQAQRRKYQKTMILRDSNLKNVQTLENDEKKQGKKIFRYTQSER